MEATRPSSACSQVTSMPRRDVSRPLRLAHGSMTRYTHVASDAARK